MARNIHEHYDKLPESVRPVVDRAYNAATGEIRSFGLDTVNTDDAERLVDAIAQYLIAANPDRAGRWAERAMKEQGEKESGR